MEKRDNFINKKYIQKITNNIFIWKFAVNINLEKVEMS